MRRPVDPERDPFELHMTIAAGWRVPPHSHPGQAEEFAVQTGTIEVLLGGSWRELTAGQSLFIPPGSVHTYRNRSSTPARAVNVHSPAGSFPMFVDRMRLMSEAGTRGLRRRLLFAMLWTQQPDSFRLARASVRFENELLATLARAAGLRLPDVE